MLSARSGRNLLNWFAIPKKRLTSDGLEGGGMACNARTFSGSGLIPDASMV